MGSNSDAYIVNPDGSISETISAKGIDVVLRAFIRVATNKSGKTTAYFAQKKAIKYYHYWHICLLLALQRFQRGKHEIQKTKF